MAKTSKSKRLVSTSNPIFSVEISKEMDKKIKDLRFLRKDDFLQETRLAIVELGYEAALLKADDKAPFA